MILRMLYLSSLLLLPIWGTAEEVVRIGILSFRSLEQTRQQWQSLADYLAQAIPDKKFQIIPLYYPELDTAATSRQLDFVLNNPEHYVLLRQSTGMAAIATLMPLAEGHPVNQFGGLIFTKADNQAFNTLDDLSKARVAAPDSKSFGGFLMQDWELYKRGVNPKGFLFTGMPHDKAVEAVMTGKADAGFVRSGVIEAMIQEGKLHAKDIKIINQQADDFPLKISTSLYPEWPFSALPDTPAPLVKAVTLALLNMDNQDAVAKNARIYGFSPPGDYASVEAIMLRLNLHPFELKNIQLEDIYFRYRYFVWAGGFLLLLIGLLSVQLMRAKRRWRRSSLMYHLVADYTSDWEYWIGPQGEILYMSPSCEKITAYTVDDFKRQPNLLQQMVHADDRPNFERQWQACLENRLEGELEFRITDKLGRLHWIHQLCRPVFDDNKRYQGIRVSSRDTTARKDIELEFQLHDTALKACAEAIVITDAHAKIQWVNPAFCKLTGYTEAEAMGLNPAQLLKSGLQDATFYRELWHTILRGEPWRGEIINRQKSGELYYEQLSITPVFSAPATLSHFVAIKQDITERKQIEETIRQLAFYDPLTQLANRRLLVDRMEHALAGCQRDRRHVGLLLLDLDRFKQLNDVLGHDAGDQLLQEVARRLKQMVRQQDTVARLGGDEFVVLLVELDTHIEQASEQAEWVANKIKEALSQPYQLQVNRDKTQPEVVSYTLTASIGISLFRDDEGSGDNLLKQADMAMYEAKKGGRNAVRRFRAL